jgi:hypothetical protein
MHRRFAQTLLSLAAALILGACTPPTTTPDSTAFSPPPAEAAAPAAPVILPVTPVTFSGCVSPHEREAVEVYAVRTDAIVGAQSCRMTDRFNKFAIKFRGELTAEGRTLRGYYKKTYGKSGDATLDKFVTELSNASFVEGSGAFGLCETTTSLFDELMATPVGHLAAFSAQHPARALPTMESCGGTPPKRS